MNSKSDYRAHSPDTAVREVKEVAHLQFSLDHLIVKCVTYLCAKRLQIFNPEISRMTSLSTPEAPWHPTAETGKVVCGPECEYKGE